MSRAKRIVSCVLLAFVCVIGALYIFLVTSPGERFVKGVFESRLSGMSVWNVHIGALETNLFSHLTLKNVAMFRIVRGDTVPLIDIGRTKITYNLRGLHARKIDVTKIELDRLSVAVRRDSAGVLDLPAFDGSRGEREDSGGGFTLTVNGCIARDARLSYHDQGTGVYGRLYGVAVEIRRTDRNKYACRLQAGGGAVSYDTLEAPIEVLSLAGTIHSHAAGIDSLAVRVPGLACRGHATLTFAGESPTIEGEVRITGDLGHIAGLAGGRVPGMVKPVAGELESSVRFAGSVARPRIAVRGGVADARIAGVEIASGDFEAAVDSHTVAIDRLTLSLLGGAVGCSGVIYTDSLSTYGVEASFEGIALESILRLVHGADPPYRGRMFGTAAAKGSLREMIPSELGADVRVGGVEYRSRPLSDITVTLEKRESEYAVRFVHESAELESHGRFEGERIDGRFSAMVQDLGPLAGLFNIDDLGGRLRIDGSMKGSCRAPEIAADITGGQIAYRHFPVDSFCGGVLFGDGTLRLLDWVVHGSLTPVNTAYPPFDIAGLTGGLSYAGRMDGALPALAGELTIDLTGFGYKETRVDRGRLRVVVDGRRVYLTALELHRDSLLVRASAVYDVPTGDGSCGVDILGDGRGPSVRAETPSVGVEPARTRPVFHDRGRLTATFTAPSEREFAVRLEGRGIDLAPLRSFVPGMPPAAGTINIDLDAGGSVAEPRLALRFDARRPRFRGFGVDSMAGAVSLDGQSLALRRLDIHDRGHRTQIEATVGLGGIEGGGYTIGRGSPFRGRATGEDIDLELLDPLLAPDAAVRGSGSFDIAWDGTLASPHPSGTIRVGGGSVRLRGDTPEIHTLNLTASILDSTVYVRSLNGFLKQTPFLARGEFSIGAIDDTSGFAGARCITANVELDLAGIKALESKGFLSTDSISLETRIRDIDLSLLQPFVPDLKVLAGAVNGELVVNGQPREPVVDGRLTVRGMSLHHPGLGQPISGGAAVVSFSRHDVVVDSLSMRFGEGSITAAGRFAHRGSDLERIDLRFAADRLHVAVPKMVDMRVHSARFTYRTEEQSHMLDGDVTLGETRFIANFKPQSILPFARSIEHPQRELPAFLRRTRLNVRIRESDEIWIDNNFARIRAHPEISIVGHPSQPNVTGRLSVVKGYVLFLDRKFEIERGVIDFTDPDRLNPVVDFEARTAVKTYQAMEMTRYSITLAIRGPLDEASVVLTSEPPLERPDIVSLLALGATRSQLTGTGDTKEDGSVRGVLLERAQALTSQRVGSYISRNVGGLLGLDQISIEGNLFRFDDSWGPELLAAKRFSDRVEITYRTNIGHLNERNIRLDYRLTRRFSLQGETDRLGRSGLDIKYGLKFK